MLKYLIALINVFWEENDINQRYFNNLEDQKVYFNNLTGGKFSPLLNFNMGNNITTTVIYRDTSNRSAEDLLKCNYAVVRKIDGENIEDRYFYANAIRQDSGNQIQVSLSLDDIQTNYFKYKNTICECNIKRACLDRFIKTSETTVKFNTNIDSKLFIDEGFTSEKRLIKREVLNLYKTPYENLTTWLNNNVLGWLYCFIDSKHKFNFNSPDNQAITGSIPSLNYHAKNSFDSIYNTLACVCVPIMKTRKLIFLKYNTTEGTSINLELSKYGLKEFLSRNSDGSYVYALKFSAIPPFSNYQNNYSFDNDNLIIQGEQIQVGVTIDAYKAVRATSGWSNSLSIITNNNTTSLTRYGVIMFNDQININLSLNYNSNINYTFNIEDIINNPKNMKFEPKLLQKAVKSIALSDTSENAFEYDLLKLGKNDLEILITEALTPDISKKYIRFGNLDGYYINETSENLTGFLNSDDNSLTIETSAYQNMLANNKNYFLQNSINRIFGATETVTGAILNKSPGNLVGGFLGFAKDKINQNLTVDNLKSSPSSINAMKGNIIFNAMISELGIVISYYEVSEIDKKIIYDNLFKFGYQLNINGKISDYDNIRTNFNYIEAEVEAITAPISNEEKTRLRERLRAIRFWNSDTINYDMENYERSLVTA